MTIATNETKSALIGKTVTFWDYDHHGKMVRVQGVVQSSFKGEDRKDYGREVLHIKLTASDEVRCGSGWSDQYTDDVTAI